MEEITNSVVYALLFISLYFEVFVLLTYLELRPIIKHENKRALEKMKYYPTVTIMVPCWNEEATISKTLHSILNLDYPADKLEIMAIDDGSTDKTWEILQKFKSYKQITLIQKENGGKHTALNTGLAQSKSDLVGCLDADSYVDKDALKHIVQYFENKKTMTVTPTVKIYRAGNVIQMMQSVEYTLVFFIRKILAYLGALYVTPGPFSIFRREVFEKIGYYRHAYNTEDLEIALRMHANHMKIENSHNAFVYTVAPDTLKKLYKQRLRWTFGFIKNIIDYKFIFFNRKYGNLGIFILPTASVSIISGIYLIGVAIFNACKSLLDAIEKIRAVGFSTNFSGFSFNIFSINTEFITIASAITLIGTIIIVLISRKMTEGKLTFGMDLVYFLTIYTFITPLWLTKAVFNAIFSIKTTWR